MPTVIETKVYAFSELNDRAKESARDWWRQCEEQDFDTESLYDDFVTVGGLLGITFDQRAVKLMGGGTRYEPTIYWTGFSSQGDGACFEGRYSYAKESAARIAKEFSAEHPMIEVANQLQAAQRRAFYKVEATAVHRGHYYHSGCMSIDVQIHKAVSDGDYNKIEFEIISCLRAFADWMYRQLEAENDYRMSDENVDESIEANEYTFTESGKRFG